VKAHIAQVEKGAKIFEELFLPRKKGKVKGAKVKQFGPDLFVAEDIGLMALTEAKYKFWIFGKYYPKACIYRIGDLYGYDSEMTTHSPDGKAEVKKKVHFIFAGGEGMSDFFYEWNDKEIAKYFNKLFGIEKTLRNIGNTWKNQINAIKATGRRCQLIAAA
jgi:hypothetical protein